MVIAAISFWWRRRRWGGEVQWESLGGLTVNFTTKNAVHTM